MEHEGARSLVLTVDRGNTTLDCRLRGPGETRRRRLAPEPGALLAFLDGRRPESAAGLSVVRGGLDGAAAELASLGLRLQVAGEDLHCPLRIAYAEPATLGVDRWVAAVAAHARCGDALVVDCGTALTFNVVRRDGSFLGGAIGVGLSSAARALGERAPALPIFDGRPPASLPATSSPDAVRAGLGLGFVLMVEALAARLLRAADLEGASRILTGGDAERLLALGVDGFDHVPELVHEGLACLLANPSSGF